jgi:hypothetical protein
MVKKIPLRKCTGCGEMKDKRDMLRVVKTKDGEFFLDTTGKANGRGAYLCTSVKCLDKALKNNGFERSFKMKIPREIAEALKEAMEIIE